MMLYGVQHRKKVAQMTTVIFSVLVFARFSSSAEDENSNSGPLPSVNIKVGSLIHLLLSFNDVQFPFASNDFLFNKCVIYIVYLYASKMYTSI
jgi:hypothetical protein